MNVGMKTKGKWSKTRLKLSGLVKTGIATGLHLSRLDRVVGAKRGLCNAPLMLGYHRVVQDFRLGCLYSMPSMMVSTRTLTQHLDWIGRRYDYVSLDELAVLMETGALERRSRPVAAITFDDGYKDVYLNAVPILQSKGIPSAMFVVTDLVGTSRLQVHDELYLLMKCANEEHPTVGQKHLLATVDMLAQDPVRTAKLVNRIRLVTDPFQLTRAVLETLGKPAINELLGFLRTIVLVPEERLKEFQLLDWDMLRQMNAAGVTIGSHTLSHVLLANEDPDTVQRELHESRRQIESQLQAPAVHFAYPDGSFNALAISAAASVGYRTACTICAHCDPRAPLLTIPRRMLWENSSMNSFGRFSPAILSCQINGIFDPAKRCRINHWA